MSDSFLVPDALNVAIDFSDIGCALTVAPLEQLVRDTGIAINVLPLARTLGNVATDSLRADDPLAEYKARRARARLKFADEELARDCARYGIPVAQGRPRFDTTALNRALLSVRIHAPGQVVDFVQRAFRAVFADVLPVAQEAVAGQLAGLPLASTQADVEACQAALAGAGVFAAPGFLLQGERFHGRQHLPLLRWMLEGRQGPPPT